MIRAAPALAGDTTGKATLLAELPSSLNSPASMGMNAASNVYFTSPNFHNDAMIAAGALNNWYFASDDGPSWFIGALSTWTQRK